MNAGWHGVVLAGGRSRRMGRDKALLPWHGTPLLLHMRELLHAAGAQSVTLSGDYPDYAAVADSAPGGGPMAALAQLAPRLADGQVVVVPVDMPLLVPGLLHALLAAPGACVACVDFPLPMRLRLDARSRAVLQALGARTGNARSLRALHAALDGSLIDAAPWRQALVNCNTPEQWRALRDAPPSSAFRHD